MGGIVGSLTPITTLRHARPCAGHPRLTAVPKGRRGWHRKSGLPDFRDLDYRSRIHATSGDKPGHDAAEARRHFATCTLPPTIVASSSGFSVMPWWLSAAK